MESNQGPDREQAAAALGLVGSVRSELADRLVTPWWYHPALGLALGLLIASFSTRNLTVVGVAVVLYFGSLIALPRAYRRATGVWVNGLTPRRARRWALRLGWTASAGMLVGLASSLNERLWPLGIAAAVVAFALTQVFGRRFDDELRAELREDPEIGFKVEQA